MEAGRGQGLRLGAEQVKNSAVERWYPLVDAWRRDGSAAGPSDQGGIASSKGRWTMATELVPLPREFVQYLQQDGMVLPARPADMPLRPADPRVKRVADEDTYDALGDVDWSDEDEDDGDGDAPSFPELEKALDKALQRLGGAAFVKLNWTSPRDATWVCGSLKCATAGDVYMLLKASDLAQHDLRHAFDRCEDARGAVPDWQPTLALRKWAELDLANEFRVVVLSRRPAAVLQRHAQTHFAHLNEADSQSRVLARVGAFFEEAAAPLAAYPDEDFMLDLYLDRSDRVWIVDFAALARPHADADSAAAAELAAVPPHELLSWADLAALRAAPDQPPTLRVVESEAAQAPDALRAHRVPVELVTGELTQDVVDQAKAQLAEMSVAGPSACSTAQE